MRLARCMPLAFGLLVATTLDALAVPLTARGVVYHDRNGNGIRDKGEPGLRGIRVSNQREVTVTDARGSYALPVEDDAVLFVVKPRDWSVPLDNEGVRRFFHVHKPAGSPALRYEGVAPTGPLPASVDFPLRPCKEPKRFTALLFGDTQPRDQAEIDYIAHDVVEEVAGTEAALGITLGDNLFNDLSLFASLKRTIGLIGVPWVYVMGNHDTNQDAPDDARSDETWERHFGPSYYSFDHAAVHFIVLDDIMWRARTGTQSAGYSGGLGDRQLDWLRNDLALVPRDRLVVLLMHIPIEGVAEREQVYRLLEGRPHTFSASAHTHTQEHRFIGKDAGWNGAEPHHHLISATVCGSWWSGAPDERGVPHATMSDGAPNGYSIVTFEGASYSIEFRAAGRSAEYQMQIHAPEEVVASQSGAAQVLVNVFAGSPKSVVEMRLGTSGTWIPMVATRVPDPAYLTMKEMEKSPKPPPGRTLPGAATSSHIWSANLPAGLPPGTHILTVRERDMFGKVHEGRRVFRAK